MHKVIFDKPKFLSYDERIAIADKVISYRYLWNILDREAHLKSGLSEGWMSFGLPLYEVKEHNRHLYPRYKELLIQEFGSLFDKICNQVSKLNGYPTEIHSELSCPGFQISVLPFFHSQLNYHVDATPFDLLKKGYKHSEFYSILIPISIPTDGAWLDYLLNGQALRFNYSLGHFHMWPADLQHKVGGYKVREGEYRITSQSHWYFDKEKKINYLYF